MNWISLEKRDRFPALAKDSNNAEKKDPSAEDSLFFPGGGYTKALYEQA